ncbi:MAG: hypothetical protein JSR36_05325 [Proteobacteria bacterium]|nr:hypothetical protein [Pseudomonadota bacterium]
MAHTWQQLEGAALVLARSHPIKDRLAEAYRDYLSRIDVEELPELLREEFRACLESLTRERPQRGEDAVRATVRKMSNPEADAVAGTLVKLYGALVRESLRPAEPAQLTPVPAVAAAAGRGKKAVPQVVSLYAHEG